MRPILRKMWFRLALVLVAVFAVATGATVWLKRSSPANELIAVQHGDIAEEVIVTGKTKPVAYVDLAFERPGRVSSLHAAVGDHLSAGAAIAVLDPAELSSALAEAEANLAAAEAKLANAELAVGDAERSIRDRLQDAYVKSDDALRNRADQFFSNPRGANPQISFTADPALESGLEAERLVIETLLTAWPASLANLDDGGNLESARSSSSANLARLSAFLGQSALALSTLRPSTSLTQTTIDAWRADVSTARANLNTAAVNLSSAEEKLRSAPGQVEAERASVDAAKAKIKSARVALSQTVLRTPISGIVTRQDAKVGEIVAANTVLASLISSQGFEIEANVPEVDIGRIQIGNPVRITLDAFPTESRAGAVARIDPAETIVEGVVNYKITVAFAAADPRLKSGLTANLAIETARKPDALLLPQSAIVENDRGTFVKVPNGSASQERAVIIGIRGQDGILEIISGLKEGEKVIDVGRKGSQP